MKLGLMGGTFDPIHLGHMAVASAALRCGLDRLDFVPARQPPHKSRPDIADPYHRFAMIALAIQGNPRMGVSSRELAREGPSWTVETVRAVAVPGVEVTLILGTDSLAEIESWRSYEEILRLAGVIAYPRPPLAGEELTERLPGWLAGRLREAGSFPPAAGEVACLEAPPVAISSTEVRRRLLAGESTEGMLEPAVAEYIGKHRVYTDEVEETGNQRQP